MDAPSTSEQGIGVPCSRWRGPVGGIQVEVRNGMVTRTRSSTRPTAVPSAEATMAVLEIKGEHVERSPLDRLTPAWPSPGDLSYTVALFWRGSPPGRSAFVHGWASSRESSEGCRGLRRRDPELESSTRPPPSPDILAFPRERALRASRRTLCTEPAAVSAVSAAPARTAVGMLRRGDHAESRAWKEREATHRYMATRSGCASGLR